MSILEQSVQQENEEELKKVASGLHAVIATRLTRHLANFVDDRQLGYILDSSATYNFADTLPKRQPDASFVSFQKMPTPLDEELSFAPDLAAEVVSKNDTAYEIEKKVKQYQQAGVGLIWVIYPVSKTVAVYHRDDDPVLVTTEHELDGIDVLPGFKLKVSELFK